MTGQDRHHGLIALIIIDLQRPTKGHYNQTMQCYAPAVHYLGWSNCEASTITSQLQQVLRIDSLPFVLYCLGQQLDVPGTGCIPGQELQACQGLVSTQGTYQGLAAHTAYVVPMQ